LPSVCAYIVSKQKNRFYSRVKIKEEDVYPVDPEDGYKCEKLFSEIMCHHFIEDFCLETRVARYNNVYRQLGTYDAGREKAPAALCRKVIEAKSKKSIDVWGDREQTKNVISTNRI